MSSPKRRQRTKVVLTDRAVDNLREIESYSVQQWGRKTADKYLDHIQAALDRLRDHPDLLLPDVDASPAILFYRVQKHVLVCTEIEAGLIVLTVFHTSMDLPARLAKLEPQLMAEAAFLQRKLNTQRPG
ncbi:MAG: type II toxin-antitoxin system RelE/ParE family toxin [Planctomycetaceae bacterium]|nr:type II toxin-antitoxin system RelE/ParE family toxin [Planctomycetaceae bacterium]